ncbi:GNAT family N-acetyltransferase [Tellurirhabdus bombi]|uniref:GNAT family N-acetyltransferase n=1 Tax=Tellurirhabdus bombi TaxID=2907205 RepID=UPI001F28A8BA|nr:GNAT family N-acetyltransferase [Tellurirhabdus bombi]
MKTFVHVRSATPQDEQIVYEFICSLEETELDPVAFRTVFLRNLADPEIHYFIAIQENTAVGFISCHCQYLLHHAGKIAEIQELYVRPEYRNQQIGRQLLAHVEQLAIQQHWINLEVTTNQRRKDAHRFYQSLDFQPSHYKFVKSLKLPA